MNSFIAHRLLANADLKPVWYATVIIATLAFGWFEIRPMWVNVTCSNRALQAGEQIGGIANSNYFHMINWEYALCKDAYGTN